MKKIILTLACILSFQSAFTMGCAQLSEEPCALGPDGFTEIHEAVVLQGYKAVTKLLKEDSQAATIYSCPTHSGQEMTPLHMAIMNGDIHSVEAISRLCPVTRLQSAEIKFQSGYSTVRVKNALQLANFCSMVHSQKGRKHENENPFTAIANYLLLLEQQNDETITRPVSPL